MIDIIGKELTFQKNQEELAFLNEVENAPFGNKKLKQSILDLFEKTQDMKPLSDKTKKTIVPNVLSEETYIYLLFAPYPTDMSRVSPFFPMNRNQLANRDNMKNELISESSWGRITYTGERLSTYDEDALVGVFALLDQAEHRQYDQFEGKSTYTYRGSFKTLLKTMGYKNPGGETYNSTFESLERMMNSTMKLEIFKKNERNKKCVTAIPGALYRVFLGKR